MLVGGRSRRMGRDKASLDLGGVPFASRLVRMLREWTSEVFVVGEGAERFGGEGVATLADAVEGVGPLGGLLTGLRATSREIAYVVACDMPFLRGELLRFLADRVGENDGAMIQTEKGVEPLCAAYRKRLASVVERMLDRGITAVHALRDHASIALVEAAELQRRGFEPLLWFNVNTPEDYAQALKLWRKYETDALRRRGPGTDSV